MLALACAGCVGTGQGESFVPYYNYNAFTCAQLQDEAADIVADAEKEAGRVPRALKVSRSEILIISWPDISGFPSPIRNDFAARIAAVEATSKAKGCAIQFGPSGERLSR
jgi:hypothetical protein